MYNIVILTVYEGGGGGQFDRRPDRTNIDAEYMSLMAELGEGPPPAPSRDNRGPMPPSAGYSYCVFILNVL